MGYISFKETPRAQQCKTTITPGLTRAKRERGFVDLTCGRVGGGEHRRPATGRRRCGQLVLLGASRRLDAGALGREGRSRVGRRTSKKVPPTAPVVMLERKGPR